MKISRTWLQKYFEAPLPDAQALADALTFHAFEIDSIEGDVLDVKVTPNRGHDCLSHRGIARELSAILQIPTKDSFGNAAPLVLSPTTDELAVVVEDTRLCPRFAATVISGVKIGASPEWLRAALEAVGQKSINNVVDATNYVMFDIGQPLHAFDAGKLSQEKGKYQLFVRHAKKGETMLGLDDKEYALKESMLVITDQGTPVSIAGVKGGKPTGVDENTTAIILEAANWDGPMIRQTSQALRLRTDASDRFQQVISPELAAYGLKAAAELIIELAGGEIRGFVDEYPKQQERKEISITVEKINAVLGTALTAADVADTFTRLDLPFEQKGDGFTVTAPFKRLDLDIPEDLAEEVARIVGYDTIAAVELPKSANPPDINNRFLHAELVRQEFMIQEYSEVYTSVFADKGEVAVQNKIDSVKPFLRSNLTDGLNEALKKNIRNKDLLGLGEVKLFEIGPVWRDGSEVMMLGRVTEKEKASETTLEGWAMGGEVAMELPSFVSTTERYQAFSRYPFIVRDIALWVPEGTEPVEVLNVIQTNAGELLLRGEKFDEFKKGEKTSLAFRLVFQSFEKTLTDEEVGAIMGQVYAAVKERGWEVR